MNRARLLQRLMHDPAWLFVRELLQRAVRELEESALNSTDPHSELGLLHRAQGARELVKRFESILADEATVENAE